MSQDSSGSSHPNHLSEFYSYIEPRPNNARGHSRMDSGSSLIAHVSDGLASMVRRPSSGSLHTVGSTIASTSFANVAHSHPDLPALITSAEIKNTLQVYTDLKQSATKYREALMTVSKAAADFGGALEKCSRIKGAGTSSDGLMAAGGLHYLVSNHQNILAKAILTSFEVPVEKELKLYQDTHRKNEEHFKNELKERTRRLKTQESMAQKMSRKRIRNLSEYRNSLLELTSQIDDIDKLKYEYFQGAYNLAQQVSTEILGYASSVVRAEVEIYEGIARKGWSGGGLDDLISSCPDPFAKDEDEDKVETLRRGSGHEIFSVLPTRSLMPKRTSSSDEVETLRWVNGLGRSDSIDELVEREQVGELDDSFMAEGVEISTPIGTKRVEVIETSTPRKDGNELPERPEEGDLTGLETGGTISGYASWETRPRDSSDETHDAHVSPLARHVETMDDEWHDNNGNNHEHIGDHVYHQGSIVEKHTSDNEEQGRHLPEQPEEGGLTGLETGETADGGGYESWKIRPEETSEESDNHRQG